jgi:hypothetical protein
MNDSDFLQWIWDRLEQFGDSPEDEHMKRLVETMNRFAEAEHLADKLATKHPWLAKKLKGLKL